MTGAAVTISPKSRSRSRFDLDWFLTDSDLFDAERLFPRLRSSLAVSVSSDSVFLNLKTQCNDLGK